MSPARLTIITADSGFIQFSHKCEHPCGARTGVFTGKLIQGLHAMPAPGPRLRRDARKLPCGACRVVGTGIEREASGQNRAGRCMDVRLPGSVI